MDDQNWKEPNQPRFTDKELVKFMTILFAAVVYAYMFLKIMFLK